MFKNAFLAAVVTIASIGAASAAPINGSFSLLSLNGTYVGGSAATATGLDFGNFLDPNGAGNGYGTNGTAFVGNAKGSFANLNLSVASLADISLGATANPYTSNPFISFGTASNIVVNFSDASITRNDDGNGVRVYGAATFSDGTAADTSIGTFNITTSTQTNDGSLIVNFTMTGNAGTTAVPEPISMSILGVSLAGLGLVRLRRKA